MKYYHGEVKTDNVADSDRRAEALAKQYANTIVELKGTLAVGRNFGDAPALLVVGLPDDETVTPDVIITGIAFKQVQQSTFPKVDDKGIE